MSDVILKPIATLVRRYQVGDAVSESDDLSPHSFESLKARGFIGSDKPPPAPARDKTDYE